MTMKSIYENEEWMVELRDDGLHLITAKRNGGYLSPVQLAYALLWRSSTTCAFAHRARKELLQALTLDERREAVKWVVETGGPMTTSELIAADMRSEIFPLRSYESK